MPATERTPGGTAYVPSAGIVDQSIVDVRQGEASGATSSESSLIQPVTSG